MRAAALALGLAACGAPTPLSVVEELRVLAIAVEPASPAPGEVPVVSLLVADPLDEGYTTWVWWCAVDVCGEGPVPEVGALTVWALACAPGACDGPGDDLADPSVWMPSLPSARVSLARRTVLVSPSAEQRLNANPVIEPAGAVPTEAPVGLPIALRFQVTDLDVGEPAAFGFATSGGFSMGSGYAEGVAELEFLAPEEPGPVDLWVVVDDGLGGTAWWTGRIDAR